MYIRNEDTICAPATVPGTGAISVIRISGREALDIADKVIIVSGGTISKVGSKEEVLPQLSEIYSTCTILEEAQ